MLSSMQIKGFDDRSNRVHISIGIDPKRNVVFFPGDAQGLRSEMLVNGHDKYVEYCYENVATILRKKYGDSSNIMIIQPETMHRGSYSIYRNFLTSNTMNEYGACKSYDSKGTASAHLYILMMNVFKRMTTESEIVCYPSWMDLKLDLIGFSKGVVVLNQLVSENGESNSREEKCINHIAVSDYSTYIFKKVESMHWLDGGNGSLPNCFPPSNSLNALKSNRDLVIYIELSPYQYYAIDRPWIQRESKGFRDHLQNLDIKFYYHIYFEDEIGSLSSHFQMIQEFKV